MELKDTSLSTYIYHIYMHKQSIMAYVPWNLNTSIITLQPTLIIRLATMIRCSLYKNNERSEPPCLPNGPNFHSAPYGLNELLCILIQSLATHRSIGRDDL